MSYLLSIIAPLTMLLAAPTPSNKNQSTSMTTTATITFIAPKPSNKTTKTGQPIPVNEFVPTKNATITDVTIYHQQSCQQWPIFKYFFKLQKPTHVYVLKTKEMDSKIRKFKITKNQALALASNQGTTENIMFNNDNNTGYVQNLNGKTLYKLIPLQAKDLK